MNEYSKLSREELEEKCRRYHAIYRFWRRYLQMFYPKVLSKIQVEGKTADQISMKELGFPKLVKKYG